LGFEKAPNSVCQRTLFPGKYTLSIVQDGKDPLVELIWDKVSSYSVNVHGSCKGFSSGMCGSWNGDSEDDYTMPNGEVAET